MPLLTVRFFSDSLRKMSTMTVILPDIAPRPPRAKFPVLYLLHGLTDDDSAWTRRSNIERYAARYPLVIVMPNADRSFYCDAVEGLPYESYIIKDVVTFTERFFNVGRSRQFRAIGGLSMGGYGSMKLALKFPNMFASVCSHSSAFDFAHGLRHDVPEFRRITGPRALGGPDDLFDIATHLDPALAPAIRFDCGLEDHLIASNRTFHRHLRKLRIPHQYAEYPGHHDWNYWDLHVQQALAFHARHLRLPS